jgi:hypothetical protein
MKSIKSWSDITVGQLIELKKLDLEHKSNTLATQSQLIKLLYGADADNMPFDEYMDKVMEITEAFSTPLKGDYKPQVELCGKVYKAVPIENFTTREFTDFDTLARDNNDNNLPLLLALIYRSDDEQTDKDKYSESVKEKSKLFADNMDAVTAVGAVSFFTNALLQYLRTTLLSSEKARMMMESDPKMKESMRILQDYLGGVGN